MVEFQGQLYFDDRLYILYLCKGAGEVNPDGLVSITIYHENMISINVFIEIFTSNTVIIVLL